MEKDRVELKQVFATDYKPTEQDFADLIDSCLNVSDTGGTGVIKGEATTTSKGLAERATLTEIDSGTDSERFVTPAGAKRAVEKHALVKSINGQTGAVTIATSSGEDTGWVSANLTTGLTDYGYESAAKDWQGVRFRKKDGVVYIQGTLKGGVNAAVNLQLFTLDTGFRPLKNLMFAALKGSTGGTIVRIDVFPTGKVAIKKHSSARVCLDGICFPLD